MSNLADQPHFTAPYLIDGHVHLHDCFDEERFFQAAAANVASAGRDLGLGRPPSGILMLTECSGIHRFADLCHRTSRVEPFGFEVRATDEPRSLMVTVSDQSSILLVAGRQLVTAEKLEVLALGCREELEDGQSLVATLDEVRATGALPVVPWGLGKWWYGRRRTLLDALRQQPPSGVFLGDNGGRASFLPKPAVIRSSMAKGIRDLPGSDPLPLTHEETRVGSFGFVLEEALDPQQPTAHLLGLLARTDWSPKTFGTGLPAMRFVRNQMAMHLRKWQSSYPSAN